MYSRRIRSSYTISMPRPLAQARPGTPTPLRVTNEHPVNLEGLCQPVRRCPGKLGPLDQFGEAGAVDAGGEDGDRLVEHAHAAHTVSHKPKLTSQTLGCPDGGRTLRAHPRTESVGRPCRTPGRPSGRRSRWQYSVAI